MIEKKRGRKPKNDVAKLETIAVRLTTEQKYLLEMLRRHQSANSLSEVASVAIDKEIKKSLTLNTDDWLNIAFYANDPRGLKKQLQKLVNDTKIHVADIHGLLWDPEEADRLVNLGLYWPRLLEYPIEQLAFKIILENNKYWRKVRDDEEPNLPKIRKDWEEIKRQASECVT